MIRIAFRFDDPSETSNHKLEESVIKLCRDYNIPINFSVIPYRRINGQLIPFSTLKAKHLVEAYHAGYIEISQHGYAHENNMDISNKYPSEFYDVEIEQQLKWIKDGKEVMRHLFGEKPIGFAPPWNSFDAATLQVLNKLDYTFISAAWKIPEAMVSIIPVIPITSHMENVMAAIDNARLYSELNPVIIVVLHHYDFDKNTDSEAFIVKFENLFQLINNDEDINATTLDKIAYEYNPALSVHAIKVYVDRQKFHWRIKKYFLQHDFIFINERIGILKLFIVKLINFFPEFVVSGLFK